MIDYIILVIIFRVLIVFIGFSLTWKTLKISRTFRGNRTAYWQLSMGFLIFTGAQVIEGILFEFTDIEIDWIHIIEGILSSISFLLIILSIYQFKAGTTKTEDIV